MANKTLSVFIDESGDFKKNIYKQIEKKKLNK